MKTRFFVPVLLLLVLAASQAAAQTVITSVPYTIQSSGHYIINGNLNFNGGNTPAIQISAPNVVLDLNGYFVASGSYAAGSGSNNSVIYVGNYANVTIKNGTVAGAPYGIYYGATDSATTSRNYVVDNVTITRCYLAGIYFGGTFAPGSIVRNCTLSTIGNSTNTANTSPSAIFTLGGIRMENNYISDVTATGTGTAYGINGDNSDFAIGNTIANCTDGIIFVSKYLNNLTYNVTTPFSGGTAATGNN